MTSTSQSQLFQLIFDIKHCVFMAGDDTKLLFSIYDNTKKEYITQQYCLHLTRNNFPQIGQPDDVKVLFKDLPYDILKNNIFIICNVYRIGEMETTNYNQYKHSHYGRKNRHSSLLRPYGVSIFKLNAYIDKLINNVGEEIMIEPDESPICCSRESETNFVHLAYDIINKNRNKYHIAPISIGIAHSYILYKGNTNEVKMKYKYCDKLTCIETLKMYSYQDRVNTDKSFLFVTITEAHVNQRHKRMPCNVATKICLKHNVSMKIQTDCIRFGKSIMAKPLNEESTVIFYHENDPIYNQMFTVSLPRSWKELDHYHLYFSCWHISASNKKRDERGFGFIKLSDMNKIENGEYDIPLYQHTKNKKIYDNYLTEYKSLRLEKNKFIKIAICFNLAQFREYFDLLVFGYIRLIEGKLIRSVSNDLRVLILQFVC